MAKPNDKKKNEKAKKGNSKKKEENLSIDDIIAKFRETYSDFINSRKPYAAALQGQANANDEYHNAIVADAQKRPYGETVELALQEGNIDLQLTKMAKTWYKGSQITAFKFADKNLEAIISGIPADKLAKIIESTDAPKKCPEKYKELQDAHKQYASDNALLTAYTESKDPGKREELGEAFKQIAPQIVIEDYKHLDIENKELYGNLFADLASTSIKYARSILAQSKGFAEERFKNELKGLKPKQITEYFTAIAKGIENKEQLYDSLYQLTEPEKGKKK